MNWRSVYILFLFGKCHILLLLSRPEMINFASQAKCSLQDNQLKALQEQLESAEKKLQVMMHAFRIKEVSLDFWYNYTFFPYQVYDISAIETRTEFEGQQKLVNELERRLADAESKVIEGEKLRKELHNTILVIP